MDDSSNVYHDKEYKCKKCKKDIDIFDVAFLGATSDYELIQKGDIEKVEKPDFIGNIECSPHMDMTCICQKCYNN